MIWRNSIDKTSVDQISCGSQPCCLQDMLVYLYLEGPYTRGIFRRSAGAKACRELREQLDSGMEDPEISHQSVFVIAAVLKVIHTNIHMIRIHIHYSESRPNCQHQHQQNWFFVLFCWCFNCFLNITTFLCLNFVTLTRLFSSLFGNFTSYISTFYISTTKVKGGPPSILHRIKSDR